QGRDIETWERPHRRARKAVLTVDHVMASAAIPLFFPAVQLEDGWHGDGSVRLTAPLSPALHLGARRIIAISTRYRRSDAEADRAEVFGYPPPAQIAGVIMNSIFLDLLDNDALELERLNSLLAELPPERWRGLRPLHLLVLRPSVDLGQLAYDYAPQLPRGFRFLSRGLGTRETTSPDLLSFILFQPDYLRALMALGERDALERAGELRAFVTGTGPAGPPAEAPAESRGPPRRREGRPRPSPRPARSLPDAAVARCPIGTPPIREGALSQRLARCDENGRGPAEGRAGPRAGASNG